MRELKFRGKRQFGPNNEWHYGRIDGYHSGDMPVIDNAVCNPDTVGQLSEWHDMEGTEVYEDDILEGINVDGEVIRPVVTYGSFIREMSTGHYVEIKGFCLMLNGQPTFPIIGNYQGKFDLEILKVVGNLHDEMGG